LAIFAVIYVKDVSVFSQLIIHLLNILKALF
jgi:hypothetical protein